MRGEQRGDPASMLLFASVLIVFAKELAEQWQSNVPGDDSSFMFKETVFLKAGFMEWIRTI